MTEESIVEDSNDTQRQLETTREPHDYAACDACAQIIALSVMQSKNPKMYLVDARICAQNDWMPTFVKTYKPTADVEVLSENIDKMYKPNTGRIETAPFPRYIIDSNTPEQSWATDNLAVVEIHDTPLNKRSWWKAVTKRKPRISELALASLRLRGYGYDRDNPNPAHVIVSVYSDIVGAGSDPWIGTNKAD